MRTSQLLDLVGPNPVLHSWGYVDVYLRQPDPRLPMPTTRARYCPDQGLWIPLTLSPARVNQASNYIKGGSPLDVTITGTNGHAFIVAIGVFPGQPAVSSVTDSNSSSYTQDIDYSDTNGHTLIYSNLSLTGTPTYVRVTFASASYGIATVLDMTGLQTTAGYLDGTPTGALQTTNYDSGSMTTTVNDSYLFGVQHKGNQSETFTLTSPWTLIDRQSDTTFHVLHTQQRTGAAAGSYNCAGNTVVGNDGSVIIAYKAAAGGATDADVSAFNMRDAGQRANLRR